MRPRAKAKAGAPNTNSPAADPLADALLYLAAHHGRAISREALMAGLPVLDVTTTGRKSGLPRTNPLTYAPDGDGFAVIGSNWGQTTHPAWSANLLTHPRAVVRLKGRTIPVDAQLTSGAERERLWGLLTHVWPPYAEYAKRANRELRIFRLTPRP